MPNVKTDQERGYIGAWMRREREMHDWSPEYVVDQLARKGRQIRVDYYRQIEAGTGGKKPSAQLLDDLIRVFGSVPEPFPDTPSAPGDLMSAIAELVTALRAQTEAMNHVTEEAAERQRAMVIEAVRGELEGVWDTVRALEARVRETPLPDARLPGQRR